VKKMNPLLEEKPTNPEIHKEERFAAQLSLEGLFLDVSPMITRNEWIHQAVQVHHYTLREVGDFLGLYFSTISVIVKMLTR